MTGITSHVYSGSPSQDWLDGGIYSKTLYRFEQALDIVQSLWSLRYKYGSSDPVQNL